MLAELFHFLDKHEQPFVTGIPEIGHMRAVVNKKP
jgi:hypothetical protein